MQPSDVSPFAQRIKLGSLCRYGVLGLGFVLAEFHAANFAGILSYHGALFYGLSFQTASQIWLLLLLLTNVGLYLVARSDPVRQYFQAEFAALLSAPYATICLITVALLCAFNGFVLEYFTGDQWGHVVRVAWSLANPEAEIPLHEVAVAAPFNQVKGYFLPYAYPYVLGFISSFTGIGITTLYFNVGGFAAGLCYPAAIYILARQIGLTSSAACWVTSLGMVASLAILVIFQTYDGYDSPAIAWSYPWMQRSIVFLVEIPLASACFLGFVQTGRKVFLIGLFWISTAAVALGHNSLALVPVALLCWGLVVLISAGSWSGFRSKLLRCIVAIPAVFYLVATLIFVQLSLNQEFHSFYETRNFWFHYKLVSADTSLTIMLFAALGLLVDIPSRTALLKLLCFSTVLILLVLNPWSHSKLSLLMGGSAASYYRFFYLLPTAMLSGITVFTFGLLLLRYIDLKNRTIRKLFLPPIFGMALIVATTVLLTLGPLSAFPISLRPNMSAALERDVKLLSNTQLANPILASREFSLVLPVYDPTKVFLIQSPSVVLNSSAAIGRLEDGTAIKDAALYLTRGRKTDQSSLIYVANVFKPCTIIAQNTAWRKGHVKKILSSLEFKLELRLEKAVVLARHGNYGCA